MSWLRFQKSKEMWCKCKLLDRSLDEPSAKETRHDSLPKKSSDTSKSPKKKKKRRQENDKS